MAARIKSGEFLPADHEIRDEQALIAQQFMAAPELEDEPDPDDVALGNVLAELGADGADVKVNVYQLDEKKQRAFVGSFLPGDFSQELIQAQFGPGTYAVEVRRDKKWLRKTTIRIAAPRAGVSLSANTAQSAAPSDNSKIFEAMQNGFREMGSQFAAALSTLAANQPKAKSTLEMLQEMQMMQQILGGAAPKGPDPMAIFEMATTIASKLTPREGDAGAGEIILEAIKNFGPVLQNAASANANPAPPVPVPAPVLPSSPTPVPPRAAPGQNQTEQDQTEMMKRVYMNMLIGNAQVENDPMTYASMALDTVGEVAALEFINAPGWFEKIVEYDSRAANYRPWFEQLRLDIIELTRETPGDINAGNVITPG
jgi:hypothetical protein